MLAGARALCPVAASTGERDVSLHVVNVNASTLAFGRRSVPLDGQSNLLLRYRGVRRTLPYVSAADVLSGVASPDTFKDKIVFVGTTALGTARRKSGGCRPGNEWVGLTQCLS